MNIITLLVCSIIVLIGLCVYFIFHARSVKNENDNLFNVIYTMSTAMQQQQQQQQPQQRDNITVVKGFRTQAQIEEEAQQESEQQEEEVTEEEPEEEVRLNWIQRLACRIFKLYIE